MLRTKRGVKGYELILEFSYTVCMSQCMIYLSHGVCGCVHSVLIYLSHGMCVWMYAADEAWEIDKSQLSLGRELGSGQFGVSS